MNKTIYIIDDDQILLESMQILLQDEGYNVITSIDSITLNENMKKQLPDLILLDLRLPGEDGETIAKRLKKNSKTSAIPIIMVSANHNAEKIASQAKIDFLSKPFDIDVLLSRIRAYFP